MRPPANLVLLIRGAADRPQDLLGGRTPLEYAELPHLRRLTRRGRIRPFQAAPAGRTVHTGGDLFDALGVPLESGGDLPMAAISWRATGRDLPKPAAMRADPVRLAVSPEVAAVMDPDELSLEQGEAEELAEALNREVFRSLDAELVVLEPARWVLQLGEVPKVTTMPLEGWIGADAAGGLPWGTDQQSWHRLVNEIQMVLAEQPVNRARREAGQPEVNSLWLWGGGVMPHSGTSSWHGVWGQADGLAGLAEQSGVPYCGAVTDFREVARQAGVAPPQLVVADPPRAAGARGNLGVKVDALEALDRQWLAALDSALESRSLEGAWVVLGPEAPTGARAHEPVPPCPAFPCRPGRIWPWMRPSSPSERNLVGRAVGWDELVG